VLDGLDLVIGPGERVALLGLNGAGKTTLLRCTLGLVRFSGKVTVAGCPVAARGREARAHIGYVPQRAPRFDGTLGELIEFFGRLRATTAERVAGHMDALGLSLDDHRDQTVGSLSGGMLQKSLLALALASEVSVLLLDEPTANLDPRARREFVRALQAVPSDTTILFASHRIDDVQALAGRLLFLHAGRFVFDGTIGDLRRRSDGCTTLWISVASSDRERLRRSLAADPRVEGILSSNHALGIQASVQDQLDLLVEMRAEEQSIREFTTESTPLEELLEGLLQEEGRG